MKTFYAIAADVVVAAHFAYVAFVVLGLLAIAAGGLRGWQWVRHPWLRVVHLAAIVIVVAESWFGITCPLTTWENALRRRAGQATYGGDFIGTWLHDVLFFELSPSTFTILYTAFGAAVLASWALVPPRWRRSIRKL
ncbi:MAG: DUF2784 domain-containing protein [Planctomycetaceae bacterium]|nr:DUF2784 domain-containing protein [Planctomycetaceae bacterium]